MFRVDTTVSSTPAWTSARLEPRGSVRWLRRLVALLAALACLLAPAWAAEPAVQQLALQRQTDGLFLSARLELEASAAVQDALLRGVPLYFVWQADVYRKRWYWTDKRVASAVRTLRLAYQPLTRRWRLSLSNEAGAGAGGAGLAYALHQNYDSLADALAGVGRISRWKISDGGRLQSDAEHRLELGFRLDLTLLPRPLQIGMAAQSDWTMELQRSLDVPERAESDVPAPAHPDMVDER